MKRIIILFLISWLVGCKSNEQKFIKIQPENDMMDYETESGTLFQPELGTEQVYFVGMIKEPLDGDSKLKQGFIVIKLHRNKSDRKNFAYILLDSLNDVRRCQHADTGYYSNWSTEEKSRIKTMVGLDMKIRDEFYNHVFIYVEPNALNVGVSQRAYLKYE